MGDPIGTYQGKPRRDDWPCGPKRPASGAERKPLAGWAWEDEVTRILPTGQMATFKVFISRENGNAWWECHESGGPWPYDDRLFAHTDDAQLAAEDAARAMVADMAAALGGSVTWATGGGSG